MELQEFQNTVRRMIEVELEAMSFYRQASALSDSQGSGFQFDLLADEELEHARFFYDLYPGELPDFDTFVAEWCLKNSASGNSDKARHCCESEVLQLALQMELQVEADLSELLEKVTTPQAREVIKQNLISTRGHSLLIEQDLLRLQQSG